MVSAFFEGSDDLTGSIGAVVAGIRITGKAQVNELVADVLMLNLLFEGIHDTRPGLDVRVECLSLSM